MNIEFRDGETIMRDRGGRLVHGVELTADGKLRRARPVLVATAAPLSSRGIERANVIARVINEGVQHMTSMFEREDEETTADDVGRLASAVEALATRPHPPVNVTVTAPENRDLGKLAAAVEKLAARPSERVEVTVTAPEPTRTPPRAVRVEYDADGTKWFVPELDDTD